MSSATQIPVRSWFDIPYVAFGTTKACYAVSGCSGWTIAHISVVEVANEKYGLIICDVLDCRRAPNPTVAQVAFVLDENVQMYLKPESQIVCLHGPSLVTLVPLNADAQVVEIHFDEREDYLSCIKVINDAEIATLDQRECMALALRRALSTAIPRHASPTSPSTARCTRVHPQMRVAGV
ncbi:hypothetical protein C8Q74DRAFT_1373534 [Fomes fomentarius]|nr:hypothetical protein C8Q74DRAFT_1373534 [Fomes fomentarius]